MKKLIILFSLLALFGCKTKVHVVENTKETIKVSKLAIDDVEKAKKDMAFSAGNRILTACNTSKFKPFNENEATPTVIQNTTQKRLTKTCLKFRLKYGDFKELKLIEVFKDRTDKTTVFRFKALYEKKIANKELRVSIDKDDKVSAIKSFDWKDSYTID